MDETGRICSAGFSMEASGLSSSFSSSSPVTETEGIGDLLERARSLLLPLAGKVETPSKSTLMPFSFLSFLSKNPLFLLLSNRIVACPSPDGSLDIPSPSGAESPAAR